MSIINTNISKEDMQELENHVIQINDLIKNKFSCYRVSLIQDSFQMIELSVYEKVSSNNISTFESELQKLVSECYTTSSMNDIVLKQTIAERILSIVNNYSNSSSGVTNTPN